VTAEIEYGSGTGQFDADHWVPRDIRRQTRPFVHFALSAATQALADAGWSGEDANIEMRGRAGVAVGVGMVDLQAVTTAHAALDRSYRRLSPYFIPSILGNMAAGHISIQHKLEGPNHSVTTACATGAHAIGDAFNFIRHGQADMMVAGGTEASIHELGLAGFCRSNALACNFNNDPAAASRPFDKDRCGFVMGEGAGIMVLESLESAAKRGAKIYAEIAGYGLAGDAYHITNPTPGGRGASRSMKMALQQAGLLPSEVKYINAHATSTPVGDAVEAGAIAKLFGERPLVSSTKGSIGHLLGAAGAVEAVFTVLAVHCGQVPPNCNFNESEHNFGLNLPCNSVVVDGGISAAITNSFGFGGTNACLAFTQFDA
jgi:3-oxoacyl-[acyl-carrier-protein] synthase II